LPLLSMDGDSLSQDSFLTATYLRVASLSIALYDFLETAPSTWRYTREQWNAPHKSVSFILFLLIQFTSISTLVVSNVGYFSSRFTEQSCLRYYIIPSVFKGMHVPVAPDIDCLDIHS